MAHRLDSHAGVDYKTPSQLHPGNRLVSGRHRCFLCFDPAILGMDGRVISIDLQVHPEARKNIAASAFARSIYLIEGDSKSESVHRELRRLLGGEKNILVCLDSDHSYAHTLAELRLFSQYVPVGGYLVLFDTICRELADTPNGDASWTYDSPMTALEEFLAENPSFASDPDWGKFLVTFAPKGFLVRKNE